MSIAGLTHRRAVMVSTLLSVALVLATTLVLVAVAWQSAYSFLTEVTRQRLDSGERAFTYFTERRATDVNRLLHRVATDRAVVDFGAGHAALPTARLEEMLDLGPADFIAVHSAGGEFAVAPDAIAPLVLMERPSGQVDQLAGFMGPPLQWQAASRLPDGGWVTAGYLMSHGFGDQFKAWTGLDISLYDRQGLAGTSLRDGTGTPLSVPPPSGPADQMGQEQVVPFSAGGGSYLGRTYHLYDTGLGRAGSYTVAHPTDYSADDHAAVLVNFLPFLAVILLVSILSTALVARQVTVPLSNLRATLRRLGAGDLETPVSAQDESGIGPLAGDLEELRQRLHAALNQLAIEKSVYQGIFRAMGNAVFTTDANGRVTSYNPAAASLLRAYPASADGSLNLGAACWGSTCLRDNQGRQLCNLACVWLWMSGEAEPTVVRTRMQPDGPDPRDIEVVISPIKDDEEQTVGLVHVVRDITLEQELLRLKERFLMSVAHELRTPLSSLSASVELLQDDFAALTPDARARMLGTVRRGTARLGTLVSDLLDLGNIQAGRFTVKPRPIPMLAAIQEAVAASESGLLAKGQHVEIRMEDAHLEVLGDSARLSQVLVNLISNAAKYGPEGDMILLQVEQRAEYARVSVSDHGDGISPEDQARVFDYYFRTGDAQRSTTGGFGIGLAITQGIVEAHGGEAGVESQLRAGSTFWFTVPLAPVAAVAG